MRAKVWYPSNIRAGHKAPYLIDPNDMKMILNLPFWCSFPFGNFLTSHFKLSRTNSVYAGSVNSTYPTDAKGWPVIIFSHGQEVIPDYHTNTCEELASKGFFVFGIYHDDTDKTFPGPFKRRHQEIKALIKALPKWNRTESNAANCLYKILSMKNPPKENLFHDKFNFVNGVGLFGHSFGATITITLCELNSSKKERKFSTEDEDPRIPITCAAAIDSWLYPIPTKKERVMKCKFLFINSDLWLSKQEDQEKLQTYYNSRSKGVYAVTFKGTSHFNFTDFVYTISSPAFGSFIPFSLLREPESEMCMLGPANAFSVCSNVNHVLTEFFGNHLLQVNKDILPTLELPPSQLYSFQRFEPKQ